MESKQLQIFISFSYNDGFEAAQKLNHFIVNSLNERTWFCEDKLLPGENIRREYTKNIHASDLFIPIVTYGYSGSLDTDAELGVALTKQISLRRQYGREFNFIIPFGNYNESPILHEIDGLLMTDKHEDIAKVIDKHKKHIKRVLKKNPFSFTSWPEPLIDKDGSADLLIAIGHSEKESEPSKEDLKNYKNIGENLGTVQSLRVAEYLPKITGYLTEASIKRQIVNGISDPNNIKFPSIECYSDWHVLKFYSSLLKERNIISFGGGDTNLISRLILSEYQDLLPAKFDSPAGSQVIYCDSEGAISKSSLKQVEAGQQLYAALLLIVPSPFNPKKAAVVAAGLTALGTQAAILALTNDDKQFQLLESGVYEKNFVRVIQGIEKQWRAIGYKILR